jgi:hypothetical protein
MFFRRVSGEGLKGDIAAANNFRKWAQARKTEA